MQTETTQAAQTAVRTILTVAVPVPLRQTFDYLPPPDCPDPDTLQPGIRLSVPFGRQHKVAYLIQLSDCSEIAPECLKPATRILDQDALISAQDLELLLWASRYYHHPVGEVISTAFPVLLRQGQAIAMDTETRYQLTEQGRQLPIEALKRAPRQAELLQQLRDHNKAITEEILRSFNRNWRPGLKRLLDKQLVTATTHPRQPARTAPEAVQPPFKANPAQAAAIASVQASLGQFQAFLLEGVTGSGKTEVYLQLIQTALQRQQQALVLLPEITLTPQLEARFRARFTVAIAVFHSGLNETERCRAWLDFQRGDACILLGTRSATWIPMQRPGLIILDEEHDSSFKQQEGFRFSARDVAVMRAQRLRIPVVLGTATPALETLQNAHSGRYQHLHLPERTGCAQKPETRLLDIRNQTLDSGLSSGLQTAIQATLTRGEQVLIFLNRRGFAPTLICHRCAWVARCDRCDANLVIHKKRQQLRCHHCDHQRGLYQYCPDCQSRSLEPLGLGTEKTESTLTKLFPQARIARIDRDSTRRKGSLETLLTQIRSGQVDILLGTQMLAKGHHFPNVTLVGILDLDAGLFSIDFRATERMAQMIVQVAGRAGREAKPGTVILQTRQPHHPLLQSLLRDGYPGFAHLALEERQDAGLPPFGYQALLRAEAGQADRALQFLQQVHQIHPPKHTTVSVWGPVAAPMEKRAGRYRYQLLLQSPRRDALHQLIQRLLPHFSRRKAPQPVRWSIDIDPIDLY